MDVIRAVSAGRSNPTRRKCVAQARRLVGGEMRAYQRQSIVATLPPNSDPPSVSSQRSVLPARSWKPPEGTGLSEVGESFVHPRPRV